MNPSKDTIINCHSITHLYGSVRCRSCTFCTFLLAGSVVVVEDCGVQDTELALLGVRDTELEPPSSSDPGQLLPGGCSMGTIGGGRR